MKKTCKQCGAEVEITKKYLEFLDKFSTVMFGKKGEIPEISVCFDCNKKSHFCFRNERTLYNRKCDATGENIIATFPQNSPYKVYKSDFWHGDGWNPCDYGRDFDFSRSFFEQFKELKLVVPQANLLNMNNENSDYCNITTGNKNCYLVFGGDYNQDVQYGTLCFENEDSIDIDYSDKNRECYFMNDSGNCYACQYAFDCENCHDCYYVSDLKGCNDCIFCTNLVRKSYCILNQQYSKEEYLEKKKALINGSYKQREENFKKFLELREDRIVKFSHRISCENVTGDYTKNSKNCENVFDVFGAEDASNSILVYNAKDVFYSDYSGHEGTEMVYDSMTVPIGSVGVAHSFMAVSSHNIFYCDTVFSCDDCFGCVGLNRKKYCILNKQYSKVEYEKLRAKIIEHMRKIGEWGQFFPHNISCYGYNESTVSFYYSLNKEEALAKGFKWADVQERSYQGEKMVLACDLPDDIKDVSDEILSRPIQCLKSKKLFKITPGEFAFYKKHNLPIPRLHSEERHAIRLAMRNPKKLWMRNCMKCGKAVETSYAPERKEKLYCEDCYLKEIY